MKLIFTFLIFYNSIYAQNDTLYYSKVLFDVDGNGKEDTIKCYTTNYVRIDFDNKQKDPIINQRMNDGEAFFNIKIINDSTLCFYTGMSDSFTDENYEREIYFVKNQTKKGTYLFFEKEKIKLLDQNEQLLFDTTITMPSENIPNIMDFFGTEMENRNAELKSMKYRIDFLGYSNTLFIEVFEKVKLKNNNGIFILPREHIFGIYIGSENECVERYLYNTKKYNKYYLTNKYWEYLKKFNFNKNTADKMTNNKQKLEFEKLFIRKEKLCYDSSSE